MYSGSMNKKQGLDLLIEVIKIMAHLPNLIWLLAGEGPTKAELVRNTSGLTNVIHLPLQPESRRMIGLTSLTYTCYLKRRMQRI